MGGAMMEQKPLTIEELKEMAGNGRTASVVSG